MATDWVSTADPATPALIDRDTLVTYGELDRLVDATARELSGVHRVERGQLVAVVAESTVPGIAMLWALWRLGAVVVPLASTKSRVPESARLVPGVRGAVASSQHSIAAAGYDEMHTVVPTSGSTGHSRSVVLTRGNVHSAVAASQQRLGNSAADRWLLVLPLYHVGGLSILWRSAAAGGTVVLGGGFDPKSVLAALSNVAWASLVPTMLVRLLKSMPVAGQFTQLRGVLVGGGHASVEVLEQSLDAGIPVLATYGMTEACSQVATMTPGQQRDELGSVGRPLDGYVVSLAPDGEVLVDGPAVSPGYLGESARSGPLKTGDLGRFDAAGRLVITGRRKTLIISGGENVDPERVESVIARHQAVDDVAVFGVPDEEWGERVVAAIVWRAGPDGSLADAVAAELERWEVPKEWRVVDAIPRTSIGKVDRSQLG
ncbi:MAG: AMP-binding protein [Acidimicrobiia bacterium]|nr:AMP-binding protein [Acidimicrobiia bacterium]